MDHSTQDNPSKKFIADWGIKHTTSSPHYPKSNGFIERHVRHIKSIIKKTIQHKGDVQVALLQVRATPIDSDLPSPAELLLGRPITTLLPSHADPGKLEHRQHLEKRTTIMKTHHDRCSGRDLPPLFRGQCVRVLDKERRTWHPGTIVEKCMEPKSYLVQTPNGNTIRRTRSHLREMYATQTQNIQKKVQFAETPKRDVVEQSHKNIVESKTTQPHETKTDNTDKETATCTRSGRIIIKPVQYKDYV